MLKSPTPSSRASRAVPPPFLVPNADYGHAPVSSGRSETGFHPTSPTSFGPTRLRAQNRATLNVYSWSFAATPPSSMSNATAWRRHLGTPSRPTKV